MKGKEVVRGDENKKMKIFHFNSSLEKKSPSLNGNLSALKVVSCCQGEQCEHHSTLNSGCIG